MTEFIKNPKSQTWELKGREQKQLVFLFQDTGNNQSTVEINLSGENAKVEIVGIIALKKKNCAANIIVNHRAKNTVSKIYLISVLQGKVQQEIQGTIHIEKGAKGSDGILSHRTITLEGAKSTSTPILEIEEDDVKASHAGTTSEIGGDELFYLQTRGLSQKDAKGVIMKGFLENAISKVNDSVIQKKLYEIFNK